MADLRLIVYSDYLCPWCYNASVRLRRIEREFGDRIEVDWRSYLLRPRPGQSRNLEKFMRYTQSWLRPAAEPEAGEFRVWETSEGPPSHSIPPHLVAKAAARHGRAAFERVHDRLLTAYFTDNRDITSDATLRAIWAEAELPDDGFDAREDPALLRATLGEYQEAIDTGITGVPAARMEGNDAFIVGAQPFELYERWINRNLPERDEIHA